MAISAIPVRVSDLVHHYEPQPRVPVQCWGPPIWLPDPDTVEVSRPEVDVLAKPGWNIVALAFTTGGC